MEEPSGQDPLDGWLLRLTAVLVAGGVLLWWIASNGMLPDWRGTTLTTTPVAELAFEVDARCLPALSFRLIQVDFRIIPCSSAGMARGKIGGPVRRLIPPHPAAHP